MQNCLLVTFPLHLLSQPVKSSSPDETCPVHTLSQVPYRVTVLDNKTDHEV